MGRLNPDSGTPRIKRSFDPIVDSETRLIVLGSLPGEASLAAGRYYAHPRNQFWRLMGAVIEQDLAALDYEDRLAALVAHRVGLWDVVESANRKGSLDGAIRDHRPNRLAELAGRLPRLAVVAFNGGTAAAIGRRQLARVADLALISLPSSSPAYTLPVEDKRAIWMQLKAWI
jgi:hypoxanthine-DNA glycosylase